jgi:hypothetical protein
MRILHVYRVCLKCFVRLQKSYWHQNKETSSYKHVLWNESFWGWIAKLHASINTWPRSCSNSSWHRYKQYTFPIWMTVVVIVHQVTIQNKCSKCPSAESTHAWTVVPFERHRGGSKWFDGL